MGSTHVGREKQAMSHHTAHYAALSAKHVAENVGVGCHKEYWER
jgi:hypothetical protein